MSGRPDSSLGGVLTGAHIRRLIQSPKPLISGAPDLESQIQPNGIDLTLESVWKLEGSGAIGVHTGDRTLPRGIEVPSRGGRYRLDQGCYLARVTETIALPTDLMAIGKPRSTLLRSGVSIHTAVWDAGYEGRSEVLLAVHNPAGFLVARGARILQLVFLPLSDRTEAYRGRYQRENLPD